MKKFDFYSVPFLFVFLGAKHKPKAQVETSRGKPKSHSTSQNVTVSELKFQNAR